MIMLSSTLVLTLIVSAGETQAYTLGDIGGHRCVVTKLPMTGHSREVTRSIIQLS